MILALINSRSRFCKARLSKLPKEAAKFDTQAWAHYKTSKEALEKMISRGIDDEKLFFHQL